MHQNGRVLANTTMLNVRPRMMQPARAVRAGDWGAGDRSRSATGRGCNSVPSGAWCAPPGRGFNGQTYLRSIMVPVETEGKRPHVGPFPPCYLRSN